MRDGVTFYSFPFFVLSRDILRPARGCEKSVSGGDVRSIGGGRFQYFSSFFRLCFVL